MYYDYWSLNKPPFDNVPDPSMYVASHTSVENAIAETLYAIEEGNECLAVVVGDVGLGKTLSLRMVIDSLDQDRYNIAFVTNPDISFVQLLKEIIGQLSGHQCEQKRKSDLLEMFNKIIFENADAGKKVLILIDEANAMSPANLESLRLLTNMQDDHRNLFTIVLAGQLELAKRLEHPNRANLFQRIGTYCRLDKIESEEMLTTYVNTRLKLAGSVRPMFTTDAIDRLWTHSEYGVPRLVNKICKLCLKAGETNGFAIIDGTTVELVADRFQRLTGPALDRRKPRVRETMEIISEPASEEMLPVKREEAAPREQPAASTVTPEETRLEDAYSLPECAEPADMENASPYPAVASPMAVAELPNRKTEVLAGEDAPLESALGSAESPETSGAMSRQIHETGPDESDTSSETIEDRREASPAEPETGNYSGVENTPEPLAVGPAASLPEEEEHGTWHSEPVVPLGTEEERVFGNHTVHISIPAHIVEQSRYYSSEQRMKAAGVLAAQTLQKYPHLTAAFGIDPVALWSQIRDVILGKIAQGTGTIHS